MKSVTSLIVSSQAFLAVCGPASAALAINFTAPNGRGDGDAPSPTISDFVVYSSAQLNAGDAFFDADPETIGGGNGGAWNYFNTTRTNLAGSGLDVTTSAPGNGFNAGDNAWNDLDPILEGYTFGVAGQAITFDGLSALASAGQTITVSAWGIGDNLGQDSDFSVTYGGATTAAQSTAFNGGGARTDQTGAVPAVYFNLVSDGSDQLLINVVSSGQVNGVSIAISPIPEPSVFAFCLTPLFLIFRRRRS